MSEIESQGRWPANAVADINNARALLEDRHNALIISPLLGHWIPVNVRAQSKICEELNTFIPHTKVSYKEFFEKNNIAKIIEDENIRGFIAVVSFYDDEIQINNVHLASELS